MNIQWSNLQEPLPERMIQGAELLFGITFPPDYRECLRVYHDASPHPSGFTVENSPLGPFGGSFGVLLSVHPFVSENIFTWVPSNSINAGQHEEPMDFDWPELVIPIIHDGGGNLVCLDYREDPTLKNPVLAFWMHELENDGLFPLCSNFTDLLESLGK